MESFISKSLKVFVTLAIMVVLIHGMTPALYAHAEAVNSLEDAEQSLVLAAVYPAGNLGELWPEAVKAWKTGPVLSMADQSPTTIPEVVPGAARTPEAIYQTSEDQGVRLSVPRNSLILSKVIPDKVSFPLIISASEPGLPVEVNEINVMSGIGYQWMIMMAHKGAIDTQAAWKNYWAACDNLQAGCGIPVCPGIEITSNNGAHALAYGQRPSKMPPHSQTLAESPLLKAIAGLNPGNSFGGRAHPRGYYSWKSWPSSSRLVELLSGETAADRKSYQLWLDSLKRNLSNTLRDGVFCAGAGNSDFHTGNPVGCTWLYSTSYASNQRDPIWAELKAGRVSASGRGDFGAFAVNGYMPGSVLKKPVSLTFTVIQQPISGAHCEAFVIRDTNGQNIWQSPLHPPEATNIAIPLPAGDTFYHVYFIFSDDNLGTIKSDVITSPVFIDP